MARLKRIVSPKWWPIDRKNQRFTFATRGAYKREQSLPLLLFVRDVLKLAENRKEAWEIIRKGEVLVDGKKRRDPNFGLGIFNVIEMPSAKMAWRAVPKNGLSFIEIPLSEAKSKLVKIVDKKTLKGNKNQLNLNDGRNMLTNEKYSTNDSLVIEVPEQKVLHHIKFAENAVCMICKGKSAGLVGKIKSIEQNRIWLGDDKLVEVPKDFVMVIGKDKPMVKIE